MTTNQTVLTGRLPLQVLFQSGEQGEVKVRLLRIKEFPDYFAKADDEEALAAFVTGKDADFIATLTVDSILAICEKAHDLNFHNACRWANRRANFNEALLPVAQKGQRLQQTLGGSVPNADSSSAKQ
jgi:hypothetical protein